jgi:DNA polymerase-1
MEVMVNDNPICTGHLFGFTKLMTSLKTKYKNCAILLALDGIDVSRRMANESYKADREHDYRVDVEMDELLDMCSLVDGVFTCYDPDYEADDVIGSVVQEVYRLCKKNNIPKQINILSTDKDMYQLIRDDESVPIHSILKFSNPPEIVDESVVRDKFNGVSPKDLVKFRAIVGDSSDNLSGYYRFRKANAAIIAENFDYDEEKQLLYLKPGVQYDPKWAKFLPTIADNMNTFRTNYSIMKLKKFDFEIIPISDRHSLSDEELSQEYASIFGIIKKYQLNQYLTSIRSGRYTRYGRSFLANN